MLHSDPFVGLGAGRSYVSDGYAHALKFEVAGMKPGTGDVALAQPAKVAARAKVAPRMSDDARALETRGFFTAIRRTLRLLGQFGVQPVI